MRSLFCLLFAALPFGLYAQGCCPPTTAPTEPEAFFRTYVEGEQDVYKVRLRATMNSLPLDLRLNMTHLVKKLYENGDADFEVTMKDAKLKSLIGEVKVPVPEKQSIRFDKQGMPLSHSGATIKGVNLDFIHYLDILVSTAPSVGESYNIEYTHPTEPEKTVKGTWKVDRLDGDIARVSCMLDVGGLSGKPMKIVSTMLLNITNLKAEKIDGQASNVPGVPSGDVKFTLERVKPAEKEKSGD